MSAYNYITVCYEPFIYILIINNKWGGFKVQCYQEKRPIFITFQTTMALEKMKKKNSFSDKKTRLRL